jgi:hypothetical protein
MKSKLVIIVGIVVSAVIALSASSIFVDDTTAKAFSENRINLTLREVGHRLLISSGNFTSRVLPVKRIDQATFQLELESEISFVPDSLVKIVERSLAMNHMPMEYMVNVLDCSNHQIVYGFEFRNKNQDIVPCLGRMQPKGCYLVQISFTEINKSSAGLFAWIAALTAVGFVGFISLKYSKRTTPEISHDENAIAVGKFFFNAERKTLKIEFDQIALSDKETRLLKIFASRPNQTVLREQLMKEVWEDEGVIVGRSLDVFVSKLRKKLSKDSSVKLSNVHGLGYKLEIF